MAEKLRQARARAFVGRERELAEFADLVAGHDRAAVVVVHGPGGIGKSTLLGQFADRCRQLNLRCLALDGRDLPPTPEALAAALAPALDSDDEPKTVVLIDSFELLAELDAYLRDQLAPRLPANAVLVLAGRHPPSVGWRTDQGWAPILHLMRLDNLSAAESGAYLARHGVPAELRPAAITFTHGHPLALALVGEVIRHHGVLTPVESADVVRVLIDRLLDTVPTSVHRAALEAAAQVRTLDEPLLAALLEQADVSDLFAWMRALPFVLPGHSGLHLHDLARDVLAADLRWRDADRHAQYHQRAREHYLRRLDNPDPVVQAAALLDLIYLHPDLRPFLQPPHEAAALRTDRMAAGDDDAVAEMITRHEGDASGRIARHWLAHCPDAWLVVRAAAGEALGAACFLPVQDREASEDPAVAAALAELAHHPPLRPGETATLIRYWLARDTYQSVSPVQSMIATQFARHFLTTPGLAVTLLPFAHPQEWESFCAYADQRRAPTADFTVGGRRYASFQHDWRLVPPSAWVARLSQREVGGAQVEPTVAPAPVLVLGEAEFGAAVRQALRDYSRTDRLQTNPLLRCRLVTTQLSGTEKLAEQCVLLKRLIKEAVDTLAGAPADRRLHRVLVRAYLSPAPTLERAAEVLELPSSTFRRLLTAAVARVVTVLWHQELGA
jgi:hypothetical protein